MQKRGFSPHTAPSPAFSLCSDMYPFCSRAQCHNTLPFGHSQGNMPFFLKPTRPPKRRKGKNEKFEGPPTLEKPVSGGFCLHLPGRKWQEFVQCVHEGSSSWILSPGEGRPVELAQKVWAGRAGAATRQTPSLPLDFLLSTSVPLLVTAQGGLSSCFIRGFLGCARTFGVLGFPLNSLLCSLGKLILNSEAARLTVSCL